LKQEVIEAACHQSNKSSKWQVIKVASHQIPMGWHVIEPTYKCTIHRKIWMTFIWFDELNQLWGKVASHLLDRLIKYLTQNTGMYGHSKTGFRSSLSHLEPEFFNLKLELW
jgi:hypothetical protein